MPESDDPDPLVAPDDGDDPAVLPDEPPEALPEAEPDDGLDGVALEDELELDGLVLDGLELEGEDDEPPLLMPELDELESRLVADDPAEPDMPPEDEDEPDVAPVPAPRLESPALSQPYRPPTATARGSRTKADFLSIDRLL